MSKRELTILGVVLAAVLILAGTGFMAYQAGVTQGLSQTGTAPPSYWGHGHRWHPHPFGFVLPLLVVILGFALLRRALWGGYCGGRGSWGHRHWDDYGPWGRGVPPGFAEWHRRAHQSAETLREGPREDPRDAPRPESRSEPRPDSPPGPGPAR